MHFNAATILALAAAVSVSARLASRQQSEIDFAGDIPDQCQNDESCGKFINTAANCPRDLSVPFTQDNDYLDCICDDKQELRQCYTGCVSTYKREGDVKKAYQLCSTNRRSGSGRGGRGGRGRTGSDDYEVSDVSNRNPISGVIRDYDTFDHYDDDDASNGRD